jgi:hypothetical protein
MRFRKPLAQVGKNMWRIAICLMLVLFIGCDGYTELKGRIVDGEGNPIPDAKVTFDRWNSTSKPDGAFHVGGTHAPSSAGLNFTVTKDGFKPDTRRIPPEDNDKMRIVLERENAETGKSQ